MKCPQCSLATSDSRDFCPNCALDLRSYKERLGIRARSDTSSKWNKPSDSATMPPSTTEAAQPTGVAQSSTDDPFADLTESVEADVPGSKKGDTLRRRRKRQSDISSHPLKEELGDLVSAFEQLQLGGEQESAPMAQSSAVIENEDLADPFALPDYEDTETDKLPDTAQVLSELEESLSSHLNQARSATESLQAVVPPEPFEDLFEDSRNLPDSGPS